MRIRLGDIRKIIREELDLGRVVFAPERSDIRTDLEEREPNTPQEQDLYNRFADWVHRTIPLDDLGGEILAAMEDPRYSDFFQPPPPNRPVFRGLNSVEWETIEEKFLSDPKNAAALDKANWAAGDRRTVIGCDFVTGRGGMSSWTRDFSVARRFADQVKLYKGGRTTAGIMNIVLAAVPNLNDNMFDLGAVQRKVPELQFHSNVDEAEVIAFGPVRVTGMYILPRAD